MYLHSGASADDDLRWLWGPCTVMSGALALRSYALIDHRHWFLRSNNNLYCMQVTYLAVGCSHHVNISKILAVRKRCNETRLSNVILSCHFVLSFIREARNFNSVCCNCCYETTGASLTARRAAYTHLCHMRVHSRHNWPRPRDSHTFHVLCQRA